MIEQNCAQQNIFLNILIITIQPSYCYVSCTKSWHQIA